MTEREREREIDLLSGVRITQIQPGYLKTRLLRHTLEVMPVKWIPHERSKLTAIIGYSTVILERVHSRVCLGAQWITCVDPDSRLGLLSLIVSGP